MGYLTTTPQTTVYLFVLMAPCVGCSENENGSVDSDAANDTATDSSGTDSDSAEERPDLSVEVLEKEVILESQVVTKTIQTVLEVTWRQYTSADQVWLRFTFEDDEWHESPKKPGSVGYHREVVLGVPEETDVTIQTPILEPTLSRRLMKGSRICTS